LFFLDKYFQLDGMTYKLVPIAKSDNNQQRGRINTNKLYQNLMGKTADGEDNFIWANMDNENLYLDEATRRMILNYRSIFSRLAVGLIQEGKNKEAVDVLDRVCKYTNTSNFEHNFYSPPLIEAYYLAGESGKAKSLAFGVLEHYTDTFNYLSRFPKELQPLQNRELRTSKYFMNGIKNLLRRYDQEGLKEYEAKLVLNTSKFTKPKV